jgi:predicted MFS family arabinose efflux permease
LGVCALLAAFVAIERRSSDPLVRLGILRCGPLVRANLGAASLAGSFFGFQFVVVLYLQQFRGWSALEAGLALLPAGVDAVIAPTLTPRLVGRFGLTRVIGAGLGVAALAYALFLPIGPNSSYAAMFPTMILTGVAFALAYGPLTIAATNGIAPDEQGLAGGLVNTSSWRPWSPSSAPPPAPTGRRRRCWTATAPPSSCRWSLPSLASARPRSAWPGVSGRRRGDRCHRPEG